MAAILKQQVTAVSTNPTKFHKEEAMNQQLTMMSIQATANQKYDAVVPPSTTPQRIVDAFVGTSTVCSSAIVLGSLLILYGLLENH